MSDVLEDLIAATQRSLNFGALGCTNFQKISSTHILEVEVELGTERSGSGILYQFQAHEKGVIGFLCCEQTSGRLKQFYLHQ